MPIHKPEMPDPPPSNTVAAIVRDTLAIASIPAPTFAEETRLAWLEQRLAEAPGRRWRDEAGNLVWAWGEAQPQLVVAAHVDTVFDAQVPHVVVRQGDVLRGPGVGDNAVAVATAIAVGEQLLADGAPAPGAIVFTVGEEGTGNLHGAFAAYRALRPQAVIALEGHGLDRVYVDGVGSVRASIAVAGPGGHSWADRGRPSAIHALLRIGAALTDVVRTDATFNVGTIGGGRSVNAIADRAEMVVELRSTDGARLEAFESELATVQCPPPLSATVTSIGKRPGGRLARDAYLLRAVKAVRAELALPWNEDAASTDANAALALGIPALALGVTRGADMHTTREEIQIDAIGLGFRQLELVVERLLRPSGR